MHTPKLIAIWLCTLWPFLGHSQVSDTLTANQLAEQALAYEEKKDWEKAQSLFYQSAEIWEKAAESQDDPYYWERHYAILQDATNSYRPLGKPSITDSLFEEIIPQIKEKLGPRHLLVGRYLKDKGVVRFGMRDFDNVFRYWNEAIEILKENLGNDHIDVALLWTNIGVAYSHTGNYQKAYENYLESLPIFRKHNDPSLGQALFNCGNVNNRMGNYRIAIDYQHQALDFYREIEDESEIYSALTYLGLLYDELGDSKLAEQYYLESLAIKKRILPRDDLNFYYTLGGLGNLYRKRGDVEKAWDYYQQTLKILEANLPPNHFTIAMTYSNLGGIALKRNNWEESERLYLEGLKRFESAPAEEMYATYLDLGSLYKEKEDYQKAIDYFKKAYQIQLDRFGESHPKLGIAVNNLGQVYVELKNWEKASELLEKGLEIRQTGLPPDHPDIASSFYNLAYLYLSKGELMRALDYNQKALITILPDFSEEDIMVFPDLSHQARFNDRYLKILQNRIQIYNELDDSSYDKSIDFTYQLALNLIEQMRTSFRSEDTKLNLFSRVNDIYLGAIDFYIEMWESSKDASYLEKALRISEKSRSLALSDALKAFQAAKFASIPPEILEKEHELRVNLNWYEETIFSILQEKENIDSAKLADFQSREFYAKSSYDSLLRVMENSYEDYFQLKYQKTDASLASIRKSLKPDQVYINYLWGDDQLYGFALSDDSFKYLKLPIDQTLENNLALLRRELSNKREGDFTTFTSIAYQLYQRLIAPFQDDFSNKDLLISPSGPLATIPFEVLIKDLPEGKNEWNLTRFLIKEHNISYLYSTSLMSKGNSKRDHGEKLLAFAPAFNSFIVQSENTANSDEITRGNLSPLNGTLKEVEVLGKLFPSQIYKEKEATEAAFKKFAGDFRILHLATHAIIDEEKPLNSYLVFSASNDSVEDDNLYAWELYNMELNAEMAVLSACNTGSGKIRQGEGVMSLGRAFAYAGVPSIVMSLWPAEDESTANLMEYFYEGLAQNLAKDDALRQAKIRYLEETSLEKQHPFYWAGFVIQGDASPLQKGISRLWIWGMAIFLIGGILFFWLKRRNKS